MWLELICNFHHLIPFFGASSDVRSKSFSYLHNGLLYWFRKGRVQIIWTMVWRRCTIGSNNLVWHLQEAVNSCDVSIARSKAIYLDLPARRICAVRKANCLVASNSTCGSCVGHPNQNPNPNPQRMPHASCLCSCSCSCIADTEGRVTEASRSGLVGILKCVERDSIWNMYMEYDRSKNA